MSPARIKNFPFFLRIADKINTEETETTPKKTTLPGTPALDNATPERKAIAATKAASAGFTL